MHNEENRIFAYVHKIDNYEVDNYGQFIEIIGIDRCVGFFKVENLFYILDRENLIIFYKLIRMLNYYIFLK